MTPAAISTGLSSTGSGRAYLAFRARLLVAPAVGLLLATSILPLIATLWFSVIDYRLLTPGASRFVGLENYQRLLNDAAFLPALLNSVVLIALVLTISILGGLALALLIERAILDRGALRLLVISPFFVMPPVSALLWKNLLMQPVAGFFAWIAGIFGMTPFDWFARIPLVSISIIVAWQWLPFACLILLTSLQSFDR